MKRLAVLAVAAGCVHAIPQTPYERCAAQGLVVDRVMMSSGAGSTVASGPAGLVYASSESGGETVSCRRAETPKDTCELGAASASLQVKTDFATGWRNAIIGGGFIALILPGVFASLAFHNERSDSEDEAVDAATAALAKCPAR